MLPSCCMQQQSRTLNAFSSCDASAAGLGGSWSGQEVLELSPALEQSGWRSVSTSHAAKEPTAEPHIWTSAPFLYPGVLS